MFGDQRTLWNNYIETATIPYICSICNSYQTKKISDFKRHLATTHGDKILIDGKTISYWREKARFPKNEIQIMKSSEMSEIVLSVFSMRFMKNNSSLNFKDQFEMFEQVLSKITSLDEEKEFPQGRIILSNPSLPNSPLLTLKIIKKDNENEGIICRFDKIYQDPPITTTGKKDTVRPLQKNEKGQPHYIFIGIYSHPSENAFLLISSRNSRGPRTTQIAKYFYKIDENTMPEIKPLLHKDGFKQIHELTSVSIIDIKIDLSAKEEDFDFLKKIDNNIFSAFIDFLKKLKENVKTKKSDFRKIMPQNNIRLHIGLTSKLLNDEQIEAMIELLEQEEIPLAITELKLKERNSEKPAIDLIATQFREKILINPIEADTDEEYIRKKDEAIIDAITLTYLKIQNEIFGSEN